ncbi:MAG: DUF3784 domain-containing protein [Dehalococcoidia bacterium]|nr:DUF3784 domain-containing protein [Dehalococcoidia bacterium]
METFAMVSANLFGGISCLVLGLIIRTGKANFLIAGYNTMSEKEKTKWDGKAIGKHTGWLLIILSIILLAGCVPIFLNIFPVISMLVSYGLFTVVIIVSAIYMNVSPRFKRRP